MKTSRFEDLDDRIAETRKQIKAACVHISLSLDKKHKGTLIRIMVNGSEKFFMEASAARCYLAGIRDAMRGL